MPTITCLGRDGQLRTFEYSVRCDQLNGANRWTYMVTTNPPPPSNERFELSALEIDQNRVRVVMANHHNESAYIARGIPEALLPRVKTEIGRSVESSPKNGPTPAESRNDRATKYWKRLVQLGGATHNPVTDIYTVT